MSDATFSIHDAEELEQFRRRHRLDPHRIARLRTAFYKKARALDEACTSLGENAARDAGLRMRSSEFEIESRHDSSMDGASKLVLRTRDGHAVEAVILRIKSGRTSLCVSSQVGCAAGCTFCATGKMGITRNLTAEEIVDQISIADRILAAEDRRVRNVVFMGMGEPLHNTGEVERAFDAMIDSKRFNLAPGHLTVSTVGLPEEMVAVARRRPEIRLALSLHAARQSVRETIVPVARQHDVEELRDAARELNRIQGRPLLIEYLMLAGVNDRETDLDALLAWAEGLDLHVNLIPFNPVAGTDALAPTPRDRREAFGAALRERGIKTTLRYSLGADIAAACGQLVRERDRRRST